MKRRFLCDMCKRQFGMKKLVKIKDKRICFKCQSNQGYTLYCKKLKPPKEITKKENRLIIERKRYNQLKIEERLEKIEKEKKIKKKNKLLIS